MSVTIMLHNTLAAQLQAQATAQNLSVEELALHILSEAVATGEEVEWRACNQRRVALIRKQFAEGLQADEAEELQHL